MSDLTKAAIVLTGALATATAAGCSTGASLGKKIGTEIAGEGVNETVTQTQKACKENPDHALCKGAEMAGEAKAATTEVFGTAKKALKEGASSAGKKAGALLGGLISGKVDCSKEENVSKPACQPQQ